VLRQSTGEDVASAFFASGAIVEHPLAAMLLNERGLAADLERRSIRGALDEMAAYEIP